MFNKYSYFLILFLIFAQILSAQPYENKIFSNTIKTVMCHKEGWPLSYPITSLNSDNVIELTFDDLVADSKNYYYSIIHCDRNWEPSNITEQEYMTGINQNPILDFQYSFNTTINYVHYTLKIPNEDVSLKYSGNYIIKVYEDFNSDEPVLTQKFMIVEQRVQVNAEIKYAMNTSVLREQQDVNFTINTNNFAISNPLEEIKVNVYQNHRLDNAILDIKPQFIRPEQLVYNYNRELVFEGGNEFRWLDLRTYDFNVEGIYDIQFHDPFYHLDLQPSSPRNNKSYFFQNDFNGQYVIETRENRDPETEAEYVMVHFYFPRNEPYAGGNIYILGGLTNWKLDESNMLRYNPDFKRYEKTLLLKQGFYNYLYAFKTNQTDKATVGFIEGSYSQAENDYLFLVYYRNISDNYDRLIGAAQQNSVKP